VLDAYPDRVVHAHMAANDPLLPQQWDLATIAAPTAWDTSQGQGVTVAVLDCGIHASHPDLAGQVVLEANFSSSTTTDDLCNHGTHVAGTIAALTNNAIGVAGVAPAAHLLNGKVLDDSGSGWLSDIDTGIQWAADNGAKVINMSLGAPWPCDTATQQAVDYAWNRGVVIVAAAGNNSASGAESPANCQNVIGVAATDPTDAMASFSNYGAGVALAAPGVNVLSTVNPNLNAGALYALFSGTSMATPHVAGVAALVWSTTYASSAAAVRDRLFATADRIGGSGSLWTYGRIDAAAAVAGGAGATLQLLAQPQRIVDTRGSGGPIPGGQSRCFSVAGQGGIPLDATGVLLNVAAVGYTTRGWLSVYPAGQPVPPTSTLNFDTAEYAMANGTIVRVGTAGQVCVSVGTVDSLPGSAQVILDATGYLTVGGLQQLSLLSVPQRLVDTRTTGGALAGGSTRCFTLAGQGGIPADATAVVLNVTAVGYTAPGWFTVYPAGQPLPASSTLNFDTSEYAMANSAIVRLGSGGQLCASLGTPGALPASAHLILDATGYVAAAGLQRVAMLPSPQRLVDTRLSGGAVPSGSTRCFGLAGQAGIPSNASGVIANVTAVGYSRRGWLTVYPLGQPLPATSTLNFDPAEYAIGNASLVRLGPGGQVCVNVGTINNAADSAHVIVDVMGYLVPAS
jgi:thermitase